MQDPGLWQYYIKRQDNIGLPLQEVKRKYLTEQYRYQEYMMNVHYSWLASQPKGKKFKGKKFDPTENSYVENGYVENYLK